MLIVKVSQNDPLDSSSQKNGLGGQRDQGFGVVLHDQEEGYREPTNFRSESSQVKGFNEMS